jgi:hypothetical protein
MYVGLKKAYGLIYGVMAGLAKAVEREWAESIPTPLLPEYIQIQNSKKSLNNSLVQPVAEPATVAHTAQRTNSIIVA